MQKRSLLVQVLLDMATGGGAKLEALLVDRAGTFDAGLNKGYNPVTVPSGNVNVYGKKGTVENHSVVVTPKVQVSRGWLNDGEIDGSGVGITAGELVDGTYNVSRAGTSDVTNYKDVSVNAGGTTSYLERTVIDEHSVRLTPKADVASGWQDSKTVTGESVDVDASGLVSGTYPVTASGEFDVTTYEKISVPSGVVSARAIKGMVANHSVLITPSATRAAGFISSGETVGQDVRVDASELVSGTVNVSQAGETDVTNYQKVSVPSGSHSASGVKGTVNNHSVSVTPRSTATAGFVASGSVDGTPVSVSASELVSGTLNVSQAGTSDVTNYAEVSVPSGGHSASANKGTVSNHSITVTPRSTATPGFVQAGTVEGAGVSVTASELVSGNLEITENGVYDVTNYQGVEVNIPSSATIYTLKWNGNTSSQANITFPDADFTGKTIYGFFIKTFYESSVYVRIGWYFPNSPGGAQNGYIRPDDNTIRQFSDVSLFGSNILSLNTGNTGIRFSSGANAITLILQDAV